MMKNIIKISLLIIVMMSAFSCDKVILDPNSTLEPEVVGSTDNLIKLINGVQQRWSTDRSGVIYTSTHLSGLNTKELRLLNPGNAAENEVLLGGDDINGGNDILNSIWTNAMLCKKEATTIINAADGAASDQSVANSLKAYALFYRALAHGTLIQYFESIPLELIENSPFKSRDEVLQNAIADLEMAKGFVDEGLSSQVTSGVINSVSLGNSVNAILARFNLMLGEYDKAISAAEAVDLNAKSTWIYDAAVPNPLAFWFGSQNVTQAKDLNFGLPSNMLPSSGDKRVPFYTTVPDATDPSNVQLIGYWATNLDEIPLYLPGEMLLIKAEAYARKNELTDAVNQLNLVLTKTASNDVFGLGANLPAYSGVMTQLGVLNEIYKNRRIELYLTGLALEDNRRFNRPGPSDANAERNRNFYPYPNAERDNNTSTPANPSI